jgi:hypothetical protein
VTLTPTRICLLACVRRSAVLERDALQLRDPLSLHAKGNMPKAMQAMSSLVVWMGIEVSVSAT